MMRYDVLLISSCIPLQPCGCVCAQNSTVSTFAARDPDTVEEDLEAYVLSSSDPTVVDTDAIVLERIDSGEWRVLVVNEQTMVREAQCQPY